MHIHYEVTRTILKFRKKYTQRQKFMSLLKQQIFQQKRISIENIDFCIKTVNYNICLLYEKSNKFQHQSR